MVVRGARIGAPLTSSLETHTLRAKPAQDSATTSSATKRCMSSHVHQTQASSLTARLLVQRIPGSWQRHPQQTRCSRLLAGVGRLP